MKKVFLLTLLCSAYCSLFSQNTFPTTGNVLINSSTDNGNQLQVNGSATTTKDIIVNGITIGRGSGTTNYNTASGYNALRSNVTGDQNTALGYSALLSNTTGTNNTALGAFALVLNSTGIRNTALGDWALEGNTTGNFNDAIGYEALQSNTSGSFNYAIGHYALAFNQVGNGNFASGHGALFNSTGNYNIGLGHLAGFNQSSGDNNIIIGANADVPDLTGSNQLNIGNIIYGVGVSTSTAGAGNVGIGTTSPSEKLSVNGNIRAKKVIVTQSGWADYVFEPTYKLPSLDSISSFIKVNKHLPEMPSASAIEKDGQDVGEVQKLLLKKVEELTLYVIGQNERIQRLEEENKALKKDQLSKK
jgi:hypothetical protein